MRLWEGNSHSNPTKYTSYHNAPTVGYLAVIQIMERHFQQWDIFSNVLSKKLAEKI